MNALRALAVVAAVCSGMAIVLGVFVFVASPSQSSYRSAGDESGPKLSFSARRAQRSWKDDTADWRAGAPVPSNEATDSKAVPVESTMSPRPPTGNRQAGSAVAIGLDGDNGLFWLTARHMTEGCSTIWIAAGTIDGTTQYLLGGRTFSSHPTADLVLVETAPNGERNFSLPLGRGNVLAVEALHVGFPSGRPAAIYSSYLGLTRVRWVDGSAPVESYGVWAERLQVPDQVGGLGGLSGGATMDRNGSVIGTVVGVSERRGRILTTRPAQIATLIDGLGATMPKANGDIRLDQKTFPAFARQLIEQRRVALLNCEFAPSAKK